MQTQTQGATTEEKLRGTKVWVPTPGRLRPTPGACGVGGASRCVGPGPRNFFLKIQVVNPAFWWLLRSLVDSLGRAYFSKQQVCQGPNQFQNFNFSISVSDVPLRQKSTHLWLLEPKHQSNGNYETVPAVKFLAFWKLRPRTWGTNTLLAST